MIQALRAPTWYPFASYSYTYYAVHLYDLDGHRYKVALRERLEEATEDQVAPKLAEGDAVMYLGLEAGPVIARTVLANDDAW